MKAIDYSVHNLDALKQAVLLMHAPQGAALTSGEHLQLSAGQNLIATAGHNADISVAKKLFIGVGQALSVFVRRLGIRLIANQGAVQLQAQNDGMALLAKNGLTLTSTEDEIVITAKKRITLNGGGSYIRIDEDGIESATAGDYVTRAGYYGRKTKASIKPTMPVFPTLEPGEHSLRFAFYGADSAIETMKWLINQPYVIRKSSGDIMASGILEQSGRIPRVQTEGADELTLTLGSETWNMKELVIEEDFSTTELELELEESDLYDADSDPYIGKIEHSDNINALPKKIIERIIGFIPEE